MIMINTAMILAPAALAWGIHIYLKHGNISRKRKLFLGILYVLLINGCTYGVSYFRGVKRIDFGNMTMSYKIKYCGMSCVFACIIPFMVYLLMEKTAKLIKGYVSNFLSNIQKQILSFLRDIRKYMFRFFSDVPKYFFYTVRSAKADLRSEVANSFLDWLWWLIEPFCMMLIYVFVFGIIMKSSEMYFPVFIFSGLTMYNFFSRGINGSVEIIRNNKGIITKVYLPKYILLFARMLVNGFKMMVSFAVVAVMLVYFKVPLTINIFWIFPIVLVLFLFTFGVGTILMHYGVYVSDLSYIVGIATNMLMYLSGIFYSISNKVPEPFGELIEKFNPVSFLIASMRNAVLYGQTPDWRMLVIWAFISVFLSGIGILTVYHNENSYVKVI